MTVHRMDRINSQLLREISLLIRREIKDKDALRAVITSVDCSRDLGHAKVFFTTVEQHGRSATQKALQKTAGFLRSRLGHLLKLRKIPELQFLFDMTEENARKMDALLDSLVLPESNEDQHDL